MQSVTFHLDGGIHASRLALFGRLILALPLLFLTFAYGMFQLVLLPFRAILLLLMGERDTRAWEQSRRIVEFCANVSAFLLLLSDHLPMRAVKVRLAYSPLVSKLELLFRIPFGFLLFFNMLVLGLVALPFWALEFLHILIHSKRHPDLHRILLTYLQFNIEMRAYLFLGVDERPELFPQTLLGLIKRYFCHLMPVRPR